MVTPCRSTVRSAAALVALALANPSVVQASGGTLKAAAEIPPIPWPTAALGVTGPFSRMVAGRLLDEVTAVVVVLRGSTPVAIVEPEVFKAFFVVEGTREFYDIAVHTRSDGRRALLGSTDGGLFSYAYDETSGTFVEAAWGSAIWSDSPRIVDVDYDLAGDRDVLGIDASGTSLLRLLSGPTGPFEESTVSMPHALFDFVVLDFFAGGALEIAADTDDGLHVHDDAGTSLYEFRSTFPRGAITLVDTENEPTAVSWLVRTSDDEGYFQEFVTENGVDNAIRLKVPPDPYDPTSVPVDLQVFATVAADWDGDGSDDLLACHTEFKKATVFLNQGSPKHFKKNTVDTHWLNVDLVADDPEAPWPTNQCVFAFSDLDGSGNAEIVAALSDDSGEWIQVVELETPLESATKTVTTGGAAPIVHGFYAARSHYVYHPESGGDPEHGILSLVFDDVPDAYLTDFDHLQVVEWSQPDPTTEETPLDAVAVRNELYEIVSSQPSAGHDPHYVDIRFDHVGPNSGAVYWQDQRHAYLQLRFVTVDDPMAANPVVLTFSPSMTIGMTIDEAAPTGGGDYAYLLSLASAAEPDVEVVDQPFPFASEPSEPSEPSPPNNGVGAIVLLDNLPSFAPGQVPKAGRPELNSSSYKLMPWSEQ
jgi:hypothetical protein